MRFDLRVLKKSPGGKQEFAYDLRVPDYQNENAEPLEVSGTIKNISGVLMLGGELNGMLTLVCDRCGKSFESEKTLEVSYMLSEIEKDEDNVYVLKGDSIELDEIFIPELILSMDMKVLCGEDCDGGEFGEYIQ